MYQSLKSYFTTILLLSMFILSSNAMAKSCYEKSPNLIKPNNDYYNLENSKALADKDAISKDERYMLNDLYKSMDGKWKGSFVKTDCRGPDRAPRKVVINATTNTTIRTKLNGSLIIKNDMFFPKNKVKKREVLELLNIHFFEFEFLSTKHLIYSEKLREPIRYNSSISKDTTIARSRHASRLVERIYEVKLDHNSLALTVSLYINGVFVSENEWSMKRN